MASLLEASLYYRVSLDGSALIFGDVYNSSLVCNGPGIMCSELALFCVSTPCVLCYNK